MSHLSSTYRSFSSFLCAQSNSFCLILCFSWSWTSIWSGFKFGFSATGITLALRYFNLVFNLHEGTNDMIVRGCSLEDWFSNVTKSISLYVLISFYIFSTFNQILFACSRVFLDRELEFDLISNLAFLKLELLLLSVSEFSIELTWKAPMTIAGGFLEDWFWNITKSISLYALLFSYFLCIQSNYFASSCVFFIMNFNLIWFQINFSVIGITSAYVPFLNRCVRESIFFGFSFLLIEARRKEVIVKIQLVLASN